MLGLCLRQPSGITLSFTNNLKSSTLILPALLQQKTLTQRSFICKILELSPPPQKNPKIFDNKSVISRMAKFQKYELLQEYFFQNENKIKSLF